MPEPAAPGRGESAIDRLVAAMTGVTAGLSLHDLLRHLVESAARLVDARYGAIGVIGDDGRLQEFVTFGAGPDMVEAIDHYPEGLGILGVLIVEPKPLRLHDLSTTSWPRCLQTFTNARNSSA